MMRIATKVSAPLSAHGEGPVWDAFRRLLFWVDMTGRKIHALEPTSGTVQSVAFPDLVCAICPSGGRRLLVAFAKEIAWIDWPTAAREAVVAVEPDLPGNRCNDGKIDPANSRTGSGFGVWGKDSPTGSASGFGVIEIGGTGSATVFHAISTTTVLEPVSSSARQWPCAIGESPSG